MMMTVYSQAGPTRQIDHLVCVELAVDQEAASMVMHSRLHDAAVLVGLDTGETIIKPQGSGDDALSFAALYDSCISLAEFRRMQSNKVSSVEELPPYLYAVRVSIHFDLDALKVLMHIKARGETDLRVAIKRLVNENAEFRAQLVQRWTAAVLGSDQDALIVAHGSHRMEMDASADTPEWQIMDPGDE